MNSLQDVLSALRGAKRMGADEDVPEGARYITLSDSLVQKMASVIETSINLPFVCRENLLTGPEVDTLFRWPLGRAEKLAKKRQLPYISMPDGGVKFSRQVVIGLCKAIPSASYNHHTEVLVATK
jgi:hypothetical protein